MQKICITFKSSSLSLLGNGDDTVGEMVRMRREDRGCSRSNPFEKFNYNAHYNLPASIVNHCSKIQQDYQMIEVSAPVNTRLFYGTAKSVPGQTGTFVQVSVYINSN